MKYLGLVLWGVSLVCAPNLAAQAVRLEQARNGAARSPQSPVEWVRGNASPANSHYLEGQSIPYRLVLSGLSTGLHTVILEWDIKQAGKHAIDYITHYEYLVPHHEFADHAQPESVDPLSGLAGSFGGAATYPIPPPSSSNSPIAGQPGASFEILAPPRKVMTIWNGIISHLQYVSQGDLTAPSASTSVAIQFVALEPEVVLAWGGHIGSKFDWGVDASAPLIGGSPYHMRLIAFDGSPGGQDRSVQAIAVSNLPPCRIEGTIAVCAGTRQRYEIQSEVTYALSTYTWMLTDNDSGAAIVGSADARSIEVDAGQGGAYTAQAIISVNGFQTACAASVDVHRPPVLTCPPDIARRHWNEVPLPDPNSVEVLSTAGGVVVSHAGDEVVTNGCYAFITRAYQAIDACGNTSVCRQMITTSGDGEPPQIICPAGLIVAEEPPDSGAARVTFPAGVASDICDPSPVVICDPPSGSILPVGHNLITCRASDASGNSNSCSFVVQVVPRIITANNLADSGPGTLRQALLDANAVPGANVIRFDFPGAPPYTIHLLLPLPEISDEMFIDGWSQLAFAGQPVIDVDGRLINVGRPEGLVITAGNTTVRGLTLYGFAVGLRLEGSGGNVVQGNIIGPGGGDGIRITSPGNLIGGTAPGTANVIGGNAGNGIVLEGVNAHSNIVQGNFIGIGINGISPLPNAQHGLRLNDGAAHNTIGGVAGEANVIAFNGLNGIALETSAASGNRIRRNSIFGNGLLGIDLGADGVTPNDGDDADSGPNDNQNSPILTSASSAAGLTSVRGILNSAPGSVFQLDFFFGSPGDRQTFLGSTSVATDATGQQTFVFDFPTPVPADQFVTATATDAQGNTSEFAPLVRMSSPPYITMHPASTNVPPGAPVAFCVAAGGSQPLTYQWRRNGANIPDATNACLLLPSTDLTHGGTYLVIVANEFGVETSDPAVLTFDLPNIPAGDNFAGRVPLFGASGVASSTNASATREPGEPDHAGRPASKSVWYRWVAPASGIATFRTLGSTFDTLLAVYAGSALNVLIAVASDEDAAGFYTSEVRFNTLAGIEYQIAVDGYGGSSGTFVFGWELEPTSLFLPEFTLQPVSQTVAPGASAVFIVATFHCLDGHHDCRHPDKRHHSHHEGEGAVAYQWFLNSRPLPGATNETLVVANVQEINLGNYVVQARSGPLLVQSEPASLQLNLTDSFVQNVRATDKFLDTFLGEPIRLGESDPLAIPLASGNPGTEAGAATLAPVVRGYTGTQVFNTSGSLTEGTERPICGVVGGASTWIHVVPERDGVLHLNTDGSSYDTVMAVFVSATGGLLQLKACDNNAGLDGRDSALSLSVLAGKTNYVVVDGVGGATGTLRFNYSLVTPGTLTALGLAQDGNFLLRVTGRPNMRFSIQRSATPTNWASILTTNSANAVCDFVDRTSTNATHRFYRALMLP